MRDVLCAEIPLILRRGRALRQRRDRGRGAYLALERGGVPRDIAAPIGMATIAAVRFAAILWRLELPVLHLDQGESG